MVDTIVSITFVAMGLLLCLLALVAIVDTVIGWFR